MRNDEYDDINLEKVKDNDSDNDIEGKKNNRIHYHDLELHRNTKIKPEHQLDRPLSYDFNDVEQSRIDLKERDIYGYLKGGIDQVKNFYKHPTNIFNWKISGVNIFTDKGYHILSQNYGSDLDEFRNISISNFMGSLEQFAMESLSTDLLGITIGKEFVVRQKIRDFHQVLTFKIGKNVPIGTNSTLEKQIKDITEQIASVLSSEIDNNDYFEIIDLRDRINQTVRNINKNNNTKIQDSNTAEFSITMAIITNSNGIPMVSRSYNSDRINSDPILVSSFIHALQLFYNSEFDTELKSIQFANAIFFLKHESQLSYGILVSFDDEIAYSKSDQIYTIGVELLERFIQSTSIIDQMGDLDDILLEPIVDEFVKESIMDLKTDYYDD